MESFILLEGERIFDKGYSNMVAHEATVGSYGVVDFSILVTPVLITVHDSYVALAQGRERRGARSLAQPKSLSSEMLPRS